MAGCGEPSHRGAARLLDYSRSVTLVIVIGNTKLRLLVYHVYNYRLHSLDHFLWGRGKRVCGVITLTLQAKRVFQTAGRNGLPEGKALRLVRVGHTKDCAPRVGITVGEPEVTDRPVIL
jgi:hypothetical protein